MYELTHAVVLAAGQGSRLRPLTDAVPKPLLPIDGRPVVARVLDQLAAAGVTHAMVVVGYAGAVLQDFLERSVPGEQWPRLTFATQEERLGSAHALQCALAAGLPPVNSLMAAADTWWRTEDVVRVADTFRAEGPAAVMGLRRWPVAQLPHRSVVNVDDELRVQTVVEKPELSTLPGATGLSGSPIYAFAAPLWERVRAVHAPPGEIRELATALQRAIAAGEVIRGVEVTETRDLTRPADLLRHNFPYLTDLVPASVTPSA